MNEQDAVKGSEGVAGYEPASGEAFRLRADGEMPLFTQAAITEVVIAQNVTVTVRGEPGS